jgi:hypothetical protein
MNHKSRTTVGEALRKTLVFVLFVCWTFLPGLQAKGHYWSSGDLRLDKQNPTVFITFERSGSRIPGRAGESTEGVWLRLHNNAKKWNIFLMTYGADNERSEYTVSYDVSWSPGMEWMQKAHDLPVGYRIRNVAQVRKLEPGQSIVFSVPKENLAEGLCILVEFSYEWEASGDLGGDQSISHRATFRSTDLPVRK